jgi:transposase
MRGSDAVTASMFSYVDLEKRVPAQHPLRPIREVVNAVLEGLDAEFAAMYADFGRPSIAPEKLLRGSLLQAFFTIRSERQLMEQLEYNLLYRWFIGLGVDDPVWDHSTYSKNRDRLLDADIAKRFLKAVLAHPQVAPLLSDEHFSVDGTLVQAWASMKSFVPKEPPPPGAGGPPSPGGDAGDAASAKDGTDGSAENSGEAKMQTTAPTATGTTIQQAATEPTIEPAMTDALPADAPKVDSTAAAANIAGQSRNAEVDFHGDKRANSTHASTTDKDARLYRKGKGKEAKLAYMGHALSENRHGLVVEATLTLATGTAEREAAVDLIVDHSPGSSRQLTLAADKAYDTRDLVDTLRDLRVTPHVAQNNKGRASAIDGRTTRHPGYAVSQRKRKLIEEAFGWAKTYGGLARPMRQGVERMRYAFTFAMAAYDLIRLPKLIGTAA